MKEKGDEAEETLSERAQLQEQLQAGEAALPRVGGERLEMAERLQEVLPSETHQLKENMREMTAKVGFMLSLCALFVNFIL